MAWNLVQPKTNLRILQIKEPTIVFFIWNQKNWVQIEKKSKMPWKLVEKRVF